MSETLTGVLYGALATVLTSVLLYLGVRYTARQSRSASKDAARIDEAHNSSADWQAFSTQLQARLVSLTARVERLEQKIVEEREDHLLQLRARDQYVAALQHQIYTGVQPPPVQPPIPY